MNCPKCGTSVYADLKCSKCDWKYSDTVQTLELTATQHFALRAVVNGCKENKKLIPYLTSFMEFEGDKITNRIPYIMALAIIDELLYKAKIIEESEETK